MKKEEAREKTISALCEIARTHFTQHGYYETSLEKIAEEGGVTRGAVYHHFKSKKGLFLAVLDRVQQDVAAEIEREAMQSEDPWQQLVLGCLGFVKAANAKGCRRILLTDAPVVVGWDEWRRADRENSMSVLQAHINELGATGWLRGGADTGLMAAALSGALNELALQYQADGEDPCEAMLQTITRLAQGFKRE